MIRRNNSAKAKDSSDSKKLSVDELKKNIANAEESYRESFKIGSCKAIMDAYYVWQQAKKSYCVAVGICKPQETVSSNEMNLNSYDEDEESHDYNSLI